jgi:hypothetical protein
MGMVVWLCELCNNIEHDLSAVTRASHDCQAKTPRAKAGNLHDGQISSID